MASWRQQPSRRAPIFLWATCLLLSLSLLGAVSLHAGAAGPAFRGVVHHAIRFDRLAPGSSQRGMSFGSQESLLRGRIVFFNPDDIASHRRRTVFVRTEQHLTQAQWEGLVALPVRGIVAAMSPFDTHNEKLMQQNLARGVVPFPVYFFPHDGISARQLGDVLDSMGPSERALLSVGPNAKAVAPVANTSVRGIHLHASLTFRPKETKMPQVLITASFDTLGVAPSARTTGGASGTVAALELWRRFNAEAAHLVREAKDATLASPFSVSLLLGNTARFNYAGTGKWVSSRGEDELDRYLLVVCLDELLLTDNGDDDMDEDKSNSSRTTLFMHVHDSFFKSPQFANVRKVAESVAARHDISLFVLSAKMNYHHYDLHFEHEVLAHRQIPAVTFSSVRTYVVNQLFRDARAPFPTDVVAHNTTNSTMTADAADFFAPLNRRVNFVHAFASALLGRPLAEKPQRWVGSAAYMAGLLRHAAEAQRSPVSSDEAGALKYAEELEAHMKQSSRASAPRRVLSTNVSLSTFRLTQPGVVLIGPYEQGMSVFVTKSLFVELAILAAVLAAVGAFALFEFGAAKTCRILLDGVAPANTGSVGTEASAKAHQGK